MSERKGAITMKSQPLTLIGNEVKLGQKAPDFKVLAGDLTTAGLADFKGKKCVILSVPSLDTPVCSTEACKFDKHTVDFGDDVAVIVISMDLPFAQSRWCTSTGTKKIHVFSDHRDASFGNAYGVLIKEARLLARAVFVIDTEGTIRYIELVPEITSEPDYEAALEAVKKLS
ncbi:MAG: thiol peroxidase [Phycisphaerales bacterium]|jgi:thiol peroxidase